MVLSYETIFSRFRGMIDDPIELLLNIDDLYELYIERLHNVLGDSRIYAKTSSFTVDDELQEIDFELKNPVNDFADKEFITKVLSIGMVIEWLKPQVESKKYTARAIGGKEEKNLQNNYSPMQDRLKELERQYSSLLSSHGYINNSYLQEGS